MNPEKTAAVAEKTTTRDNAKISSFFFLSFVLGQDGFELSAYAKRL